jgi:hypothetical protein
MVTLISVLETSLHKQVNQRFPKSNVTADAIKRAG